MKGYLEKSLSVDASQLMQIPKGPEAGIQKKYTSIKQHIEYLQVRYEQKQTA